MNQRVTTLPVITPAARSYVSPSAAGQPQFKVLQNVLQSGRAPAQRSLILRPAATR
ncbi:hypothetical protein BH11PSE8_BH11PSE8_22960 [soil metagenome]